MNTRFGDLVTINLSTRSIRRESCPLDVLCPFLGGRGLGVYLLLQQLERDVQPFEAENPLIFATGLLTGTEMISSSRLHICTRSTFVPVPLSAASWARQMWAAMSLMS